MLASILTGVGLAIGLLGVAGAVWGIHVTRIYAGYRVAVDMEPGYRLSPASLGLGGHLKVEYDGQPVRELRVFLLTVRNCGRRDVLQEIDPSRRAQGVVFPSIEFSGLRIAGYHTLQGEQHDFYIALSKSHQNRKLWLNIQKIRKGKRAEFQVVCVPDPGASAARFDDTRATLRVGYVPDLKVVTSGMLEMTE